MEAATTKGMTVKEVIDSQDITIKDKIAYFTRKSIKVPAWSDLEKEYNPKKHPVHTDPTYVDKGKEKLTRVSFGWQKLAVKRMAALIFGIPVQRVWTPQNDREKLAAQIMEDIYKRNRIDSVNIDRGKRLYASCEAMTIWFAQEAETMYAGQKSRLKLRCRSYSPDKGDKLYPLFDEYDDLVALSVEYTRREDNVDVTYFDVYTDDTHVLWSKNTGEEVQKEEINIGKIAGVYFHRDERLWEEESNNVYEAEWMLSRNGNYIRKNSRPQLALYTDGKPETDKAPKNANVAARDIIKLNKGDKLEYVTWQGSTDAIKFQMEEIKHNFNSQLQLPDMSMDNMKSSPMSGESRKMLFMDAQMKVTSEAGLWLEGFDRELNVLRAYCKVMFPSLADAFDAVSVEHVITPYQIRDQKEDVETLATAVGAIASRKTCVQRLGWVEDADEEVKLIESAQADDVFTAMQ